MILDQSGSMQFSGTALVDTGQPCNSAPECLAYMTGLDPSYTPKYNSYSCKKGSHPTNTCHFTRWDVAISALSKVVKEYGGTSALNYQDRKVRFGLVLFHSSATLASPIYKNPPDLIKILNDARASGGTNYTNAFNMAKNHINDSLNGDILKNRKTAVLFITDGDPNEGCSSGTQKVKEIYELKDEQGKQREIKTYAIGFGSGISKSGENCLTNIARAGHTDSQKCNTGRCLEFYAADSAASLAEAFQDIVNQATKEICDGLDNDCDGQIDNSPECSCVQSYTPPASTSAIHPRSPQRQAGVGLFTFISSFDTQGVCPLPGTELAEDIKIYMETCRNDPDKAVSCTPEKEQQDRPSANSYEFYCNRCCNDSGPNTCSWPRDHSCRNAPWQGSGAICVANCKTWCQSKKRMALNCLMPRGFLTRSGTGYDTQGRLTVLHVTQFGEDALNKQKQRWLFVNLPQVDHRTRSLENRPQIANIYPNDYDLPTDGGSSWSNPSDWHGLDHKFHASNASLTTTVLGIDTTYCGNHYECEQDKNELIWTILGYNPDSGAAYRTHRLGAIYHSTPTIVAAPRDLLPDPNYQQWLNQKIPAGSFSEKTVAQRPTVLYVASNDGVLHAFHTETGLELWGLIPSTILNRLRDAANGQNPDGSRVYTFDGSPLVQDVQLYRYVDQGNVQAKWITVLIAGYRAGGRGYVALDVTNPYKPRMLWEINHTTSVDPNTPAGPKFHRLGYTYGQPFIANLLIKCSELPSSVPCSGGMQERAVAVVPGGINLIPQMGKLLVDQNNTDIGAVIYLIDLESGILIREMSINDARGFASTPVGYGVLPAVTTRVFAGDVLGRIFRLDLENVDPKLWKIELFYNLFTNQGEKAMPIMSPPAIAINERGEVVLFGGTGDTENLNFVHGFDKIFSLREVITLKGFEIDKVQAVPNYVARLDKILTNENTSTKPGPEVTIKSSLGERVTGQPVVFNGTAYFTTYTPSTDLPVCGIPGHSRVYGIHFNDQCRTRNCFQALLSNSTPHYYHQVLAYVTSTITPLKCCEADAVCNAGSDAPPPDSQFLANPSTCGDMHYTIPMLQDRSTAQPFQYFRYLSLGANTLAMGASFTYQPGVTEVQSMPPGAGAQGHTYKVRQPGSYFLSFQIAGLNPASNPNFRLSREIIPATHTSLESGNFTTLGLAHQFPPVLIASWGAVLE
jgi:hypothetical protein